MKPGGLRGRLRKEGRGRCPGVRPTGRSSAAREVLDMEKANEGQLTFGSAQPERLSVHVRYAISDARKASSADQMVADADQSASDADQVSSDTDQTAADRDQFGADRDQVASDLDQATADKDRAAHGDLSSDDRKAYESSR